MFFKRKPRPEEPSPPEPESEEDESDDGDEDDLPPESDAADAAIWRERLAVIPGGASTGSKRAEALYGAEGDGPTHFVSAAGCELTTREGDRLLDCTMALGAVALGYAEPAVTDAVVRAAAAGHVAGLSHVREVVVAERLCDVVPCAEAVRFLKTGAEGVAAAIRVARTYTGRSHVIASGYFGWLDWSSDAEGVPPAARQDVTMVPFDDRSALDRAARDAGDRLAAIVIEPVVERLPSEDWIRDARTICDRAGAVLIFDEVKTGFRLRTGGYQELVKIEPDIAVFGKALANGYPLAAVVGRAELMDAARRTWISSTLAGEATALAAAEAVLAWHERAEVCEGLWETGAEMRAIVGRAIEASGIDGVELAGIDPMWLLRFDDPARETRFLELALDEGVLFKRGAYNFPCLAHDEDALTAIEHAASTAFVALRLEAGR
ncbi:MAG TPA: aminotransferase class III-fold pyridoxal phosphate-dependent enzyme [Gemmatimonadaceae bacterium]|nr:aminotransferase class III-fold pyridoxal phosphate-dependent enzyme [Gemmatimonadaceae bacterium]